MKNFVWVVSGGILQVPVVQEAQRLGLKALVTDADPAAPCSALADEFHAVSTSDIQANLDLAAKLGGTVRGVCGPASDTEVTVAAIAESLGLPTCGVTAAMRCKHKALMRRCLKDINFLETSVCNSEAYEFFNSCRGVVVKPVDNSASRGVTRVDSAALLMPAVGRAVAASGTGTCLIEQAWNRAFEYTCEIIFDENGDWHPVNICDRFFTSDPVYAIEYGIISPSNATSDAHYAMFHGTAAAARKVGVRWGVFKVDWLRTSMGAFKLLECTARLSGGFDSTHTQPLAYGTCPVRAVILQACGEPLDTRLLDKVERRHSACFAALPPHAGKLTHMDVQTPLLIEGVRAVYPRKLVGELVAVATDCAARLAFVITQATSRDAAIAAAERGVEALDVRVESH